MLKRSKRITWRTILLRIFLYTALVCGLFAWVLTRHSHPNRYVAPVKTGDWSTRPISIPLVDAVQKRDVAAIKKLLDQGVSPDAIPDRDEEAKSALEEAAGEGDVQIVQLLLDRGADINARDFWGGTALISASFVGHTDVVRLLLSRGADVDADDDGATALGYASQAGHTEIVKMLKHAGARSSGSWYW